MKILACTDGSEQSRKALKEAASIAAGMKNAEVTVIYVEEPLSYKGDVGHYFSEDSFEQLQHRVEEDRARIKAETREIFGEKKLQYNLVIKEGHPAETIIETASKEGFDLLVLGNRGKGGLDKLLLGSVSNAVAHEAQASVMIIK